MPVNIIDTLKPKNGLNFPVVEAIDVFVENYGNLADAISHFATDAMIAAINAVLSGKANTTDVNTAVADLQAQIDQIEISASAESVVAPEVAAARVDADGTQYSTLKGRLDASDIRVSELYKANGIIASKGQTFAGSKVSSDSNRITNANQDKFRCIDIDYASVSGGKLYAILKLSGKTPIIYIVGRNSSGVELFNSTWKQFTDGTDILSLIADKDKTNCASLSVTYALTSDGTTSTIYVGIDEYDYQLTFTTEDVKSDIAQIESEIDDIGTEIEQTKEKLTAINSQLYKKISIHDFLTAPPNALNTEYLWIDTTNKIPQNTVPELKTNSSYAGELHVVLLSKNNDNSYNVLNNITVNCIAGNNTVPIPNAETIADAADIYIGFYSIAKAISYRTSGAASTLTRIAYSELDDTITPSGEYSLEFSYELKVTSKTSSIDELSGEVENLSDEIGSINSKIVVVSKDVTGDYSDLLTAITTEPENTTILVKPGVYDIDMTSCLKKRIILIGSDRNQCIIRDSDGRYGHHPLYVSCGYFENLTITAPYVSGESQEIGVSDLGAYAVHIDTDDDYGVGKQIEFHHCNIKSDFFPAIGAGLRKDLTLIIDNCELINNQVAGRGDYSDEGTLGALYVHNTNGVKGNQYLKMTNSVLKSNLGNALCLYQTAAATEEDAVYCEFVNNVLHDKVNGFTNNIWFRGYPFSETIGRFEITLGYGNSNSDLNS